ncbi:hypothetical protein KUCAC02_013815 [Chaenocephalus aceratus]|uniref:Uncharacterized protein n=1 Tax=Chaenocephalus aceratus TaxID=36190 RepID=A0ACB9WCM0_CHAAC|nr:hypothetical protein KUCAC02_013815 [Chaenocephalus aceratus]
MQGKERSFCTGCWRIALLFCVLALHLMPLSVHVLDDDSEMLPGTNATEQDKAANVTALLNEEEGPVKVNEVVVAVTGSSANLDAVTQRTGRTPRAGEEEDDQSSGMFGETLVPAVDEVAVSAPPSHQPRFCRDGRPPA